MQPPTVCLLTGLVADLAIELGNFKLAIEVGKEYVYFSANAISIRVKKKNAN